MSCLCRRDLRRSDEFTEAKDGGCSLRDGYAMSVITMANSAMPMIRSCEREMLVTKPPVVVSDRSGDERFTPRCRHDEYGYATHERHEFDIY